MKTTFYILSAACLLVRHTPAEIVMPALAAVALIVAISAMVLDFTLTH